MYNQLTAMACIRLLLGHMVRGVSERDILQCARTEGFEREELNGQLQDAAAKLKIHKSPVHLLLFKSKQ